MSSGWDGADETAARSRLGACICCHRHAALRFFIPKFSFVSAAWTVPRTNDLHVCVPGCAGGALPNPRRALRGGGERFAFPLPKPSSTMDMELLGMAKSFCNPTQRPAAFAVFPDLSLPRFMLDVRFLRVLCGALAVGLAGLLAVGCASSSSPEDDDARLRVVATTNILGDLVRQIAGDRVDLVTLMGPGVDPHLYKASQGDIQRMASADWVLYNGLHLEGKMTEIFPEMERRGIATRAAAASLPDSLLIPSAAYASAYDPHVWFDVALWQRVAATVGRDLARLDTAHAAAYRQRAGAYVQRLDSLDRYATAQMQRVPEAQRVLITSHDAFRYLGQAYAVEVRGLQGISTTSEAGTRDVQNLADFVTERRIPALFVESSVSPRGIQAVQEAVESRGFSVRVGGTLYGDALGDRGTPTGTYTGAVRHNIDTIVQGLTAPPATAAATR